MKKETRTVVYDDELRMEAYRFEGIVQPFPNHFHEYYVIGILTSRRVLFYGILFMIPALFLLDFKLELIRFSNPVYVCNIIYLGLGASALCFVTWNFAVKVLGAIKTSIYLYMVPIITVVTSVLILRERMTALSYCWNIAYSGRAVPVSGK
jgi:drug/metabolite transporter (DMT)-like permease